MIIFPRAAFGFGRTVERVAASIHRSIPISIVAMLISMTLAACGHLGNRGAPAFDLQGTRAQLSVGYSLLYQEADGIPKLKWILMFKDMPEQTGQLIHGLTSYYERLAETMRGLSKQYPAMRIDATTMSHIESEERKAIGEDMAKDFAPLAGKSGAAFEREVLLMFHDSLNEQRHLTGVMLKLEPDPGLKQFLEKTMAQLNDHYAAVGSLLNQRYFTH